MLCVVSEDVLRVHYCACLHAVILECVRCLIDGARQEGAAEGLTSQQEGAAEGLTAQQEGTAEGLTAQQVAGAVRGCPVPRRPASAFWKAGTGYGSGKDQGPVWDAKAAQVAQAAQDHQRQQVLRQLAAALALELGGTVGPLPASYGALSSAAIQHCMPVVNL